MTSNKQKLTILIGTESYYPTISGVSVFSRLLGQALAKKGHDVHIICPSTKLESYDEKEGNVHIHRIRSRKNPLRTNHRNTVFGYSVIQKHLKKIKPDVIHLQDPLGTCKAIMKIAHRTNVPIVMTNHFAFDYVLSYLPLLKPFHPSIAKYLSSYLTNMYNQCSYLTFPSETIRQKFTTSSLTVPSKAISNGVDLEQFFPSFNYDEMKDRYHIPDKPIILHVGRLDQDKQSHIVLDAFKLIKQKLDAHLIICGEGNMKPALQAEVANAGLDKNVTFIGFINHNTELPQMYQMATVFTTASTIETQGIVALEAMASELPLVVPNAGALPELVKDGVNGYLFEPNNTEDMAQKLIKILLNEEEAVKMGERSLEMVEEHEIEKSMNKFESIYLHLVK